MARACRSFEPRLRPYGTRRLRLASRTRQHIRYRLYTKYRMRCFGSSSLIRGADVRVCAYSYTVPRTHTRVQDGRCGQACTSPGTRSRRYLGLVRGACFRARWTWCWVHRLGREGGLVGGSTVPGPAFAPMFRSVCTSARHLYRRAQMFRSFELIRGTCARTCVRVHIRFRARTHVHLRTPAGWQDVTGDRYGVLCGGGADRRPCGLSRVRFLTLYGGVPVRQRGGHDGACFGPCSSGFRLVGGSVPCQVSLRGVTLARRST